MRALKVAAAAALATSFFGCAAFRQTDKAFVADREAARMYQENRFERACVQKKGPDSCDTMKMILDQLSIHDPKTGTVSGLLPLASAVEKVGALPAQERQELLALERQLARLP